MDVVRSMARSLTDFGTVGLSRFLKSLFPMGLKGRAILILLFPAITIQVIVAAVFIQKHHDRVTRQMVANFELHIGLVISRINSSPDIAAAMGKITPITVPLNMLVEISSTSDDMAPDRRLFYDFSGKIVIDTIRQAIPNINSVDLNSVSDGGSLVVVRAATTLGEAKITINRRIVSPSNPHQLLVLMIFAGAVMTAIALVFLKNQLKPIIRLGRASSLFGKGEHMELEEAGATEVREAIRAFTDMRSRIESHVEQRTLMLSCISHDLKTPLARLRVGLELLETSPDTEALIEDVNDMTMMVKEFLDFARDAKLESTREVSIVEIARKVVEKACLDGNHVDLKVDKFAEENPLVEVRPIGVRRAIENLVDNSCSYGDRCTVTVASSKVQTSIVVEDNGKGIPPELRERAMRPFVRLDSSRTLEAGIGSGLGLAISKDVATRHGGSLVLGASAVLGGLKATLALPTSPRSPGYSASRN